MAAAQHGERHQLLAQIHIGKKALGLPDDAYRALLSEQFGVISSAALSDGQCTMLIAEFERRGWRRGRSRVEARGKDSPGLRKARALLADAGRNAEYGDALAKRIAQVDRLEWCSDDQLRRVIAALEIDAKRRAAKALTLPPVLQHIVGARPDLDGRIRGMVAGSMRNPRNTIATATDWALRTLRTEAEERAALGPVRTPYRNDRQYARDKRADDLTAGKRNREYVDALDLIGLIDRARLEHGEP